MSGGVDVCDAVEPSARLALRFAMDGEWKRAAAAVQGIQAIYGGEGVMHALIMWCDTCFEAAGANAGAGPVRPVWLDVDTGRVDVDAAQVRPTARWAGQVMAARLAMDEATFCALMAALPGDPAEIGRHVWELLVMAARTINQARGRVKGPAT